MGLPGQLPGCRRPGLMLLSKIVMSCGPNGCRPRDGRRGWLLGSGITAVNIVSVLARSVAAAVFVPSGCSSEPQGVPDNSSIRDRLKAITCGVVRRFLQGLLACLLNRLAPRFERGGSSSKLR